MRFKACLVQNDRLVWLESTSAARISLAIKERAINDGEYHYMMFEDCIMVEAGTMSSEGYIEKIFV